MIKKGNNLKPSRTPIILLILLAVALFILIYVTIFSFAQIGNSDSRNNPHCYEASAESNKNNYVFLVCGKDTSSGLTDVILIAKIDVEKNSINIVQIPRDTFVCLSNNKIKKINSVACDKNGVNGLKYLLESSYNIKIDYTLEFTLASFSRFIDLIGGVIINVPCDMDYEDPSQKLAIHLKQGGNLLYGDEASAFVRFRSGYIQGDLARIDAQKIFLASLAQTITKELSASKIPAIVGALIGEVNTNMSLTECLRLSKFALNTDISNIKMVTLPGRDARSQVNKGAWYYIINRESACDVINKYIALTGNPVLIDDFDSEKHFCSAKYPHFEKIYNDQNCSFKEYQADKIINNGIDIDLIQ